MSVEWILEVIFNNDKGETIQSKYSMYENFENIEAEKTMKACFEVLKNEGKCNKACLYKKYETEEKVLEYNKINIL